MLSVQGEFAPSATLPAPSPQPLSPAAGERGRGEGGLSAALRNFRVEHPHAIAGSAKSLRIGLFPGEFGEPFPINGGQRKSWDVRLTFFGNGAAPDARTEALSPTRFCCSAPSRLGWRGPQPPGAGPTGWVWSRIR